MKEKSNYLTYKKYTKEIKEVTNISDDVDLIRNNLLNYYSNTKIEKNFLIKRYSKICCNQKYFASYMISIITGLIIGAIGAASKNIILSIIISFICIITGYRIMIGEWFSSNDEAYIYNYEKKLIEAKLKKDYNFEVNPDVQIK